MYCTFWWDKTGVYVTTLCEISKHVKVYEFWLCKDICHTATQCRVQWKIVSCYYCFVV